MGFDQPRRPDGRAFFELNSQPANRPALFDPPRYRRYDTQSFALALDFDRYFAIRRRAHDGTERT